MPVERQLTAKIEYTLHLPLIWGHHRNNRKIGPANLYDDLGSLAKIHGLSVIRLPGLPIHEDVPETGQEYFSCYRMTDGLDTMELAVADSNVLEYEDFGPRKYAGWIWVDIHNSEPLWEQFIQTYATRYFPNKIV